MLLRQHEAVHCGIMSTWQQVLQACCARTGHEHAPVASIELFFDLVFVFAVTQLSHSLLAHLSFSGAIQALMLFLAVWWLWIFTAGATNWLDPEKIPVRLLLLALMLGSLLLSASIPEAFDEKGRMFGCVFAAMQIGRSALRDCRAARASPRELSQLCAPDNLAGDVRLLLGIRRLHGHSDTVAVSGQTRHGE
jgi:low temperature requirement protein LtrA